MTLSALLLISSLLIPGFSSGPAKKGQSGSGYEGIARLPGLNDSVTVCRDERGMPHIYASGEHDLYLATGYISAQERLWQMDLIRRTTTGRLSEILGKSFLQVDIISRCLNMSEKSKLIIQNEDPEIIACLEAYTEGVNSYI